MLQPVVPVNEGARPEVGDKNIFSHPPEEEFQNITSLASYICKTPESFILHLETSPEWFKIKTGKNQQENERLLPFTELAFRNPSEVLVIEDTRENELFKELATFSTEPVIFFAGMPLCDVNARPLGILCVIGSQPESLEYHQKNALKSLARQVEILYQLHYRDYCHGQMQTELDEQISLLKSFAGVVSHDMKMPLANMIVTTDILKSKYGKKLPAKGNKYLDYLKNSSLRLSNYINGILTHYESHTLIASGVEEFDLNHLLEEIIDLLYITEDCIINLPDENHLLKTNRSALEQIFLNLMGNSIKYNRQKRIVIDLGFSKDENFYYFTITDNGIGIPKDKQEDIFKLFGTLSVTDRQGNKGTGIGLSTVKKLVHKLGGKIGVESEVEEGTTFSFSIKRTLS